MFDRQLTLDGREEDVAPVHAQDRLFSVPRMPAQGSLALDEGEDTTDGRPGPQTAA